MAYIPEAYQHDDALAREALQVATSGCDSDRSRTSRLWSTNSRYSPSNHHMLQQRPAKNIDIYLYKCVKENHITPRAVVPNPGSVIRLLKGLQNVLEIDRIKEQYSSHNF